ncbi:inosine guanosine and [Venturia nashicola]|uniref:Purine nucleoside phosphorylase n=1 Tax=Venturia nashicola TaxID=86259 RepID=A0A4Z1NUG2_9PEZI|nr:inosine guanosine and [Venturia nashicola]TLD30049.1 inosine guanosine and [Venturia nashicola]
MDNPAPLSNLFQRATDTAAHVRKLLPEALQNPKVAIVCGSGLGGLADTLNPSPRIEAPYGDIPGFAVSTVQGHAGKLVFGTIGKHETPVMLLVGRAHFYEGHSMDLVTFATRVCKRLNVETMIVTNAAGGLNQKYEVGDIVLLKDHLNLAGLVGVNPLRGPNHDDFGVRFPPLSDAYDLSLRRRAHACWKSLGFLDRKTRCMHEGIYAFVAGPSYETRAECRMLNMLGADVVGMSTVPEIMVARHSGIKVLAFSLVTNKAVLESGPSGNDVAIQGLTEAEVEEYLSRGRASHEEVLEAGRLAAEDMQAMVKAIVEELYAA